MVPDWGGIHFSDYCANKIKDIFNWHSVYLPIVSFAIVFLGIVIGIYFLAKLLANLAKGLALGGLDKVLGALLGSLKYALIISVLIYIVEAIEKSYPIISFKAKNESVLYAPISKIAPLLIHALNLFLALRN